MLGACTIDEQLEYEKKMNVKEYTVGKLRVSVLPDRLRLGELAAARAAAQIRSLLARQQNVNLVFASAPSQNEFLEALCAGDGIDWSRVNAFHMDEYIGLAPGHEQSFGRYLKDHLFDHVPLGAKNYIRGDAANPEQECARYENLLRANPIDIVLMGIGENTHIAFNEPHIADFNDPQYVKIIALDDISRMQQVHDGCFARIDQVPSRAITLTVPALFSARSIFCMVPGSLKAGAIYATLHHPINPATPASILRAHNDAGLFLDEASAEKLNLL